MDTKLKNNENDITKKMVDENDNNEEIVEKHDTTKELRQDSTTEFDYNLKKDKDNSNEKDDYNLKEDKENKLEKEDLENFRKNKKKDESLKSRLLKNKNFVIISLILLMGLISFSWLCTKDYIDNYAYTKNYFKDEEIASHMSTYIESFKNFYDKFKDYDKKDSKNKIIENEMYKVKIENNDKLNQEIKRTNEKYTQYLFEGSEYSKEEKDRYVSQKNEEIKSVEKMYKKSDDELRKEIISKTDNEYKELKATINGRTDIKYYMKDIQSNRIYTNLDKNDNVQDYIKNKSIYSFTDNDLTRLNYYGSSYLPSYMDVKFIIPKYKYGYGPMYSYIDKYNAKKNKILKEGIVGPILLFISIVGLIYIIKNKKVEFLYKDKVIYLYKKIPIDFKLIMLIFPTVFILNCRNPFITVDSVDDIIFSILVLVIMILSIIFVLLSIWYIKLIFKKKVNIKKEFYKSMIFKFYGFLGKVFENRNVFLRTIGVPVVIGIIIFGAIILIGPYTPGGGEVAAILGMIYMIYIIVIVIYKIMYFSEISKGTKKIVSGDLEVNIKERGKGEFSKLAANINEMKEGLDSSFKKQAKSEKFKSELITNVSHDLKTPLTSIINYVDLLKNPNLDEDERKAYIEVLDRKSQRIKVLIEDLFEASKVASGAIELNIENVDIVALLRQSLAEFDEKIKESSLDFKVNIESPNIHLNLDGKRTWRVFENLIGNALKYSQPNTRVYVDLEEYEKKAVLTIKNISAYEMNFDANELVERFKRGDTSRNTEGSGLGLAIAKSIVDLQGGSLDIKIDGDLFKVIVEFYKDK